MAAKALFQFSYQMKARVEVDKKFIWLGHILCELGKSSVMQRREGVGLQNYDGADKMESVWLSRSEVKEDWQSFS